MDDQDSQDSGPSDIITTLMNRSRALAPPTADSDDEGGIKLGNSILKRPRHSSRVSASSTSQPDRRRRKTDDGGDTDGQESSDVSTGLAKDGDKVKTSSLVKDKKKVRTFGGRKAKTAATTRRPRTDLSGATTKQKTEHNRVKREARDLRLRVMENFWVYDYKRTELEQRDEATANKVKDKPPKNVRCWDNKKELSPKNLALYYLTDLQNKKTGAQIRKMIDAWLTATLMHGENWEIVYDGVCRSINQVPKDIPRPEDPAVAALKTQLEDVKTELQTVKDALQQSGTQRQHLSQRNTVLQRNLDQAQAELQRRIRVYLLPDYVEDEAYAFATPQDRAEHQERLDQAKVPAPTDDERARRGQYVSKGIQTTHASTYIKETVERNMARVRADKKAAIEAQVAAEDEELERQIQAMKEKRQRQKEVKLREIEELEKV